VKNMMTPFKPLTSASVFAIAALMPNLVVTISAPSSASLTIDTYTDADGDNGNTGALCAPTGVCFEARPTGFAVSEITLPGLTFAEQPTSDTSQNVYDPSFHEITYIWTVTRPAGAASTFAGNPHLNLPDIFNNRNTAYGKKVAFCFDEPGDYTVECWAVDANGTTATATVTFQSGGDYPAVQHPDDYYTAERTFAINPAGDSDFTWAPTGAREFWDEIDDISVVNAALLTSTWDPHRDRDIRFLFKPGATYTFTSESDGFPQTLDARTRRRMWFGGADGTPPIMNTGANTFIGTSFRTKMDSYTWANMDFRGGWDPTTETGFSAGKPINSDHPCCQTYHRVFVRGYGTNFSGIGSFPSPRDFSWAPATFPGYNIYSECASLDHATFGYYSNAVGEPAGGHLPYGRHKVMFIGTTFAQSPLAINEQPLSGSGTKPYHNDSGCYRSAYIDDVYFGGCDLFSNNGIGAHQSPGRINNGVLSDATTRYGWAYISYDRCAMEGGSQILGLSGNHATIATSTRHPCNAVFDKLLLVGTPWTAKATGGDGWPGGSTLRNILFVVPDTDARPNYSTGEAFSFSTRPVDDNTRHSFSHPLRLYNCTAVMLRSTANNNGQGSIDLLGAEWVSYSDRTDNNNGRHWPNLTTSVTDGPFTSATLAGFTPRYAGYNDNYRRFDITLTSVAPGGTFDVLYSEIPTTLWSGRAVPGHPVTDAEFETYWTVDHPGDNFHWITGPTGTEVDGGRTSGDRITAAYLTDRIRFTNNTASTTFNGTYRINIDRSSIHPGPDSATATPASLHVSWVPTTGSSLLDGYSTGLLAHTDITGAIRSGKKDPDNTAEQGAFEA